MGSAKPVEVPRDFLARMGVLLLCVAVAEPFSLRSADSTAEATPQHGAGSFMHFIANSVNASADPCQDFFQFACGSYVESTPYLPHLDSVSVTDQMEEKLRLQLNELLAEPASDREPAAFEKAKALYRSCVNTTLLEEKGLQPARDILSAIGGWPLLELEGHTWDESKFDWKETMYKLVDMGLNGDYLFSFGLGLDIRNTSKYIIEVGMPNFNLDLKALDEAASLTAFQNYVREMRAAATMLMKSESPSSSVIQETMLIALFEIDLNSRTKSLEDRRNLTLQVNHMSLSALQERYPFVPWMEYIRRVLPTAANITVDEIVNVADIEFMDALGRLLAITHKRTLANYLVWRTLEENVLPYLDSKARAVFVQGKATRSGRVGQRWDECVKLVQQSMQLVTSAMYVRRHSSTATRASARKMVLAISQEMHRLLQSVDWMDSHTRRAAIQKADVMGFNVAFPDELLNDTMLDEQFQGVEISADRLLDNVLRLQRDAHLSYARLFHTDYKKEAWAVISGYVDVVNAFYAHGANSLSIPAGILNGAFFEKDRPQHVNFGAIGFIIGHEISHGFDETGSLFNANGVMEDWWDDETKQRFDEKVRCVVQQYSSLRSEAVNVTVNGVLTQSENIADNAALKLAYSAYHRHVASHGAEAPTVLLADGATSTTPVPVDPVPTSSSPPALSTPPALVLSARQMFWVAFASVWCSKQAPEKLNIMLRTSSHLPGVHRVNGAVRNQEAFAADFGCPQGSPMNPVHKCQVW